MSLESKIETLTQAILALTEQLTTAPAIINTTQTDAEPEQPVDDVVDEKPKEKVAKKKKAKPAPVEVEPATAPTVDDLQALCMEIVREDRDQTAKIKEAISSFGGAKTIKQVNASDLPALKELLDAIKEATNA